MDVQEYLTAFTSITPNEARAKIEAHEPFVVFIGRTTCPYCVRFIPKLHQAATQLQQEIYYMNSQDTTNPQLLAFRTQYEIPTVPGLLVLRSDGHSAAVCDSSLSVDEIIHFIQHHQ